MTDAAAVKRSVRNLVQIGQYEKPFHPEIASGVRDMLFENMTPFTAQTLSTKIKEVIEKTLPVINNLVFDRFNGTFVNKKAIIDADKQIIPYLKLFIHFIYI